MRKIIVLLLLSLSFSASISAQKTDTPEDSLYYAGRYMPRTEYNRMMADYDRNNYNTAFMPGLAYTFYRPKVADSLGNFHGVTVEYLFYGSVHQNDDAGPSHVRFYGKLNILQSDKENINAFFMYGLGLDMSIERNPKRTYLIPYFGLEAGGMTAKKYGTTLQFTPTLGVHLLSRKNIFINLHGGYMYPIRNFDTLQGWTGQIGVNFSLW